MRVLVVQSDSNMLYQHFVQTFRQNLPANIQLSVSERAEDFSGEAPDLVVTVGVKAADWLAGRTTAPMLMAMIPSAAYADLLSRRRNARQTSAIYLDQPWTRQAGLLHAAMPERSRIGVLYSSAARLDVAALRAALAEQGDKLIARSLRGEPSLYADLDAVLADSDVLLAVPDNTLYNSNNIRNILLSSYRRGIPLIGFSQAYVKAGALCAIYSTPEHLAEQSGMLVASFALTRKLPEAQYPRLYSIAVNQEVARTLGITLNSVESLRVQIESSFRSTR